MSIVRSPSGATSTTTVPVRLPVAPRSMRTSTPAALSAAVRRSPSVVVSHLADEARRGAVRGAERSDVRRASSATAKDPGVDVGADAGWPREPDHDVLDEVPDGAEHAGTLGPRSVASAPVPAPIGLIANPASGRDIRRLVANASTSTLNDKVTAVRRVLIGAAQCGAERFVVLSDGPRIVRRAAEPVELDHLVEELVAPRHHDVRDTIAAARAMGEVGCAAVVVLGGDGTNRAVALGWPSAPVIPISTGTNNAFPLTVEPTLAGIAAGVLASGVVALGEVGRAGAGGAPRDRGGGHGPRGDRRGPARRRPRGLHAAVRVDATRRRRRVAGELERARDVRVGRRAAS